MKIKKFLSELLSTFLLVFLGTTAYALLGSTGLGSTYSTVAGIIGIAVVFGLAMTFVYYVFSSISGAHVNPAVSVAMYFNGAISLVEMILYIVAQLLGALLASGLLLGILKCIPSVSITTLGVGQTGYSSLSMISLDVKGAILIEAVLTFVFVLVYLHVVNDERLEKLSGLLIGGALTLVTILGIPFTGASINPARSFGPAVIMKILGKGTALNQLWVFLLSPLIGALVAYIVYKLLKGEKIA